MISIIIKTPPLLEISLYERPTHPTIRKTASVCSCVCLQKIQRIHMIGELTKGACSMFGANASATPDGALLQLRALDWDVDG